MTKAELIEALEELDDSAEIKIAIQPNYPLMVDIENICILHHEGDAEEAVIACSGGRTYGSSIYWEADSVEVDDNGEPIKEDDED